MTPLSLVVFWVTIASYICYHHCTTLQIQSYPTINTSTSQASQQGPHAVSTYHERYLWLEVI